MVTKTLILLAGVTLVAAACSSGDDDVTSAVPEVVVEASATEEAAAGPADATDPADGATDPGAGSETDEEAALAFTECMRDEGIDLEDPAVDADGSIQLNGGGGPDDGPQDIDPDDAEAAFEVCGSLLDGTSLIPSTDDLAESEDEFLAFAQCLRDEGIDVDDPDISSLGGGGLPGPGLFGDDFDPEDPDTAAAIEVCAPIMAGAFGGEG